MGKATDEECEGYRQDLRIAEEQEVTMREKLKALDDRDLQLLDDLRDRESHWNDRSRTVNEYDRHIDVLSAEIAATEAEISRTPEADSWRLRSRLNDLMQERASYVDTLRPSAVRDLRNTEEDIRSLREKRETVRELMDRSKGSLIDIQTRANTARFNLANRCPGW